MSKYSFIDSDPNIPGKQCFCVDTNSAAQFTYANPITNITKPYFNKRVHDNTYERSIHNLNKITSQAPVSIDQNQVPSPAPIDVEQVSAPVSVEQVSAPVSVEQVSAPVSVEQTQVPSPASVSFEDQTFLLSPQVRNGTSDREKRLINTVNNLLTQTVNNLGPSPTPYSNIVAANQIVSNLPNNSLTVDNDNSVSPNINLNTMANLDSKKNYRTNSSNLSLFENFEQDNCNTSCKVHKKHRHGRYGRHGRHGRHSSHSSHSSNSSNSSHSRHGKHGRHGRHVKHGRYSRHVKHGRHSLDSSLSIKKEIIYILIIIIIFLIFSYFSK
jgi:hypothetical protein